MGDIVAPTTGDLLLQLNILSSLSLAPPLKLAFVMVSTLVIVGPQDGYYNINLLVHYAHT